MKIVIFGLTISSSWGNGHATLWRGLCRSLIQRGHELLFFERDVPYYAAHRDISGIPGMKLQLYSEWAEAASSARNHLRDADAGIVTSYCPDAIEACRLLMDSKAGLRVFYDLDTPITLERARRGQKVEYLPANDLADFDLVLSYTGGRALEELRSKLRARHVAPLYGSVDPEVHSPAARSAAYASDLSYIGTYARDRQPALEAMFLKPAAKLPHRKFFLAGSMYPESFPWKENIFHIQHLPPGEHSAFYSSSRITLNLTRGAMARFGYCPSGRLFEAAACGVPVLSDSWEGLDSFFAPGSEILITCSGDPSADAVSAIELSDGELRKIGKAARERALEEHSSWRRSEELERALEEAIRKKKAQEEKAGIPEASGIIWGIIPAAGSGTRIQPLAFSKELLPVGSRVEKGVERPRAVSEFLAERMVLGGATKLCFVISPGKSDILEYYGGAYGPAAVCYAVQPEPAGLCDALFRAIPLVQPAETVAVGLPDTVWYPEAGFRALPGGCLSFLLFPVKHPELFDAVVIGEDCLVEEIEVKKQRPRSHWIWGAFKMPGKVFHELHALWRERGSSDEYLGTLVNEYIRRGGMVRGVKAGESYVDVGTLNGYREAVQSLSLRDLQESGALRPEIQPRTKVIPSQGARLFVTGLPEQPDLQELCS